MNPYFDSVMLVIICANCLAMLSGMVTVAGHDLTSTDGVSDALEYAEVCVATAIPATDICVIQLLFVAIYIIEFVIKWLALGWTRCHTVARVAWRGLMLPAGQILCRSLE